MTQKDVFKAYGVVAAYFDQHSPHIDSTICFRLGRAFCETVPCTGIPLLHGSRGMI